MKKMAAVFIGIAILAVSQVSWGTIYQYQLPQALYGNLDQHLVGPNDPGPPVTNNYCSPTATMNSFVYLDNLLGGTGSLMGGQPTWLAAARLLAGQNYMNTSQVAGTTVQNMIAGKVQYLTDFSPVSILYEGQYSSNYAGAPAWLQQNTTPQALFLANMLRSGEDVELGIWGGSSIGHNLTLTSMNWDDVNNNQQFDGGEQFTIDGIDPWTGLPFLYNLATPGAGVMVISGGAYNGYVIELAVAESVPEPSTYALLCLSLGVVGYARKRMSRKEQ